MLYLKTIDEAGQPIDPVTLQTVEDAMRGVALTWGGGQFGLAGVERGTSTKEGQSGWITAKWASTDLGNFCGRSPVGVDATAIELNYRHACSCGSASKIYPTLARHELGHAFGYWHTDSGSDVMYGQQLQLVSQCDHLPSAREVYHAQLAYQSPVGSSNAIRGPVMIVD
jgi:hypothetical protein